MPEITSFFDGACEPKNPGGTASYGAVVFYNRVRIWDCSEIYVPKVSGQTSNNVAEYLGFISILKLLKDRELDNTDALISGDSKLVIEQMSGNWRISAGLYIPFATEAAMLLSRFRKKPELKWIPREKNTIADDLSKACLVKVGITPRNWKPKT